MSRVNLSDDSEDDVDDVEEIAEEDRPYTRNQIAGACKKSPWWVRSQELVGKLTPKKDEKGRHKFTQEDMDTALEIAEIGPTNNESADIVKSGTQLTKVAVNHLESILRLAHEPAHNVMLLLQEENARSKRHFEELWEKYVQVLSKYEEMLQAHAERELLKEQALASERRKDIALQALMENGPKILNNIMNKDKGLADLYALLKSLDDEQLTALMAAELITESQYQTIKKIRGTIV